MLEIFMHVHHWLLKNTHEVLLLFLGEEDCIFLFPWHCSVPQVSKDMYPEFF